MMKNIRSSTHRSSGIRSSGIRRSALPLFLASLTFAAVAHAGLSSIGDSEVDFLAVGPAGLKIEGSGSGLSAKETGDKLAVRPVINVVRSTDLLEPSRV